MPNVSEQEDSALFRIFTDPEARKRMGSVILSSLGKAADATGYIRYGVPVSEKERMAISGQAPGFEVRGKLDTLNKMLAANRSMSAYLAGKRWGTTLPQAFNLVRETAQGASTWLSGGPFFTPEGGDYPESYGFDRSTLGLVRQSAEKGAADAWFEKLKRYK